MQVGRAAMAAAVGDFTPAQWNDWRWQLRNRISAPETAELLLRLSDEERRALEAQNRFRVDITPYFFSLLDADDPQCPLRRQVLPTEGEFLAFAGEAVDPLAEDTHSPVQGILHRYPDRVTLLATMECASYCRFCTRSRIVGNPEFNLGKAAYREPIEYIRGNPAVRDVLITGGDPLMLNDQYLDELLSLLRAIPHVEIVRFSTRLPTFMPQRIDDALCAMLARHHPIWVNLNVNHPAEITPEFREAAGRLADAGVPLGSQTVLMAGINDCPSVMRSLMHRLVQNRIRPYYIYMCDSVRGTGHLKTSTAAAINIMESLRGHTSGLAIPTMVIDAPGGGGKIPIGPNYIISRADRSLALRNFEGRTFHYDEPRGYAPHESETCEMCMNERHDRSSVFRMMQEGSR